MLRRLRPALGTLIALGAAALTATRLLEPHLPFPVPQLAAFAPLSVPFWVLAVLLLLGRGRARIALTVLVVAGLALQVWWLLPSAPARRAATAPPGGTPLVVMAQNAKIGGADAGAIVRAVVAHRVDVLVVTELTTELDSRLAADGLAKLLPYTNLHPGPGAAGTGTWSRWPVHAEGHVAGVEFSAPRTRVDLPDGRRFRITGVHPRSPQTSFVPQWRRELLAFAADARTTTGARIYAGDFNSGSSHSEFRAITAAGLADSADAADVGRVPGLGFTWPADKAFPPLTRIDHVLVTPASFAVSAFDIVSVPGTDHRGVVASLILRGGGPQE